MQQIHKSVTITRTPNAGRRLVETCPPIRSARLQTIASQASSVEAQVGPYLCDIVLSRAAVVTEPAEKGLVDAARRLPGLTVGRQVLSTLPQDGVGEGHGRS